MDWDVEPDECLQSSTFWLYVYVVVYMRSQHFYD